MVLMYLKTLLTITLIAVLALNITYYPNQYRYLEIISPHENPANISGRIDPVFILRYYVILLRGLLNPSMYNLTELIKYTSLFGLPSDIMHILQRINELILELNEEINRTKYHLNRARLYITYGIYDEALNEINISKFNLAKANITYSELVDAVDKLCKKLNPFLYSSILKVIAKDKTELLKLLDQINALLMGLDNLINHYYTTARNLYEKVCLGRSRVIIAFSVNSTSVWIGEPFEIKGYLRDENGSLLPNRKLIIRFGNKTYTLYTNSSGLFKKEIYAPYYYGGKLILDIFYIPEAEDKRLYIPIHNSTIITIKFIKTQISLIASEFLHPCDILNISITVWPITPSRIAYIYLDDILLKKMNLIYGKGYYSYKLPPNISIGPHILKVFVKASRKYSSASKSLIITVSYIGVILNVSTNTGVVFYPFTKINVFGSIRDIYGNNLSNELIEVYIAGKSYKLHTNSSGRFTASFYPPFHNGLLSIRIEFKPQEPWYPNLSRTIQIVVINQFLIIGVFGLITITAYLIKRRYSYIKDVLSKILRSKEDFYSIDLTQRSKRFYQTVGKVKQSTREISKAYLRFSKISDYYELAVRVLSKLFREPLPNETLREYYKRIEKLLEEDIRHAFFKLTLLREYELYSTNPITSKMIEEAKRYYNIIIKNIS